MGTKSAIEAAQTAIGAHNDEMGIDDEGVPSIALFHVIVSLIEWCDAWNVDFDATLSEVRQYFAEVTPTATA